MEYRLFFQPIRKGRPARMVPWQPACRQYLRFRSVQFVPALTECVRRDPHASFAELGSLVERHNGLWNAEAEQYLLEHVK